MRIGSWGLALAVAAWTGGAHSQSYPSKPIRIVLPYVACGNADITARTIAQKLGESLGAPSPLAPFVDPLERLGLPYCVTRSVAASVYGEPRLTADIDVILEG